MTVSLALNNALSGLRAAQASLAVVSGNVANVNTVGYTRKSQQLSPLTGGSQGLGVQTGKIVRTVDEFLRRDVRRETSVLGQASVRNEFMSRLQDILGNTSDGAALATKLSAFSASLDAYATSPELAVNQDNVVSTAESVALSLNRSAAQIQTMRLEAAQALGDSVDEVNTALGDVEKLNRQILRAYALGEPTGDLADQRDLAVSKISENMDIQTFVRNSGEMVIYTRAGRVMLDGKAQPLSYSTPSNLGYNTSLPPIYFGTPQTDITTEFSSGKIAGLIDITNNVLPNATAQLNAIAEALYGNAGHTNGVVDPGSAEMEVTVATGTFAKGDSLTTTGAGSGSKGIVTDVIDAGNGKVRLKIQATYGLFVAGDSLLNSIGGTGTLTAVTSSQPYGELGTGATSPSATQKTLDLRNVTTTPVVGQTITDGTTTGTITGVYYDATAQTARVAMTITAGTGFTLGTTPSKIGIGGAATVTGPELVGINDSNRFFGNVDLTSSTTHNNASSITVHPDLVSDLGGNPSLLGLATMAQQLADSLKANLSFAAAGGMATQNTTITGYAGLVVSNNADLTAKAEDTYKFQSEYQLTLQNRSAEIDGVNIDEEMSNMILYQNAYGASAKVIDTATKMFDTLLSLGS